MGWKMPKIKGPRINVNGTNWNQFNPIKGIDHAATWVDKNKWDIGRGGFLAPFLKGNIYGKTTKHYGDDIPMPGKPGFKGLEALTDGGILSARTLSGTDIAREMENSPWYKMALDKQAAEQGQLMNTATQQAGSQAAQASAALASRGGLRGGAAERLANQAAENMALTKQNILGQGAVDRSNLGMQSADLASKLGQFNTQQLTNNDVTNLNTRLKALGAENDFNKFIYGEDMKFKGAGMSAQATENAGGDGLCCFIFLEARYGDGTMDEVVRKYRNEKMTDKNRRGYYKLSEVLVPVMRKSKFAKFLVRASMTDPLVSYGKWYYGKGKIGWLFKPVVDFWMKTFDYLGLDHHYVRENGEVV